jgi:hypothetical protein
MKTNLDPLLLLFSKHVLFNHLGLNRNAGQTLETQPNVAIKLAFGLNNIASQKCTEH